MTGADGADCVVRVPLGTLVYEAPDGALLGDISTAGQELVVAHGGKGGFGNEHFKSATNQTPRNATPGADGEEFTLRLELKLIADVGLVGKPNAGKSTMLRAMSRATPKVADYPFTTRSPNLGIAELGAERRLVVADIPGLIEGASAGAGLGHEFLRHVERTTVLVHLLDVAPADGTDPAANYRAICAELSEYSEVLADKPEIIVLNKIDLVPEDERADMIELVAEALHIDGFLVTSGATREGVPELLEACWEAVGKDGKKPGWGNGT
jgi:GTP-binding protein